MTGIKKTPKEWVRAGKTNKHHILAKSRGGESIQSNLLRMDINRHCAFHLLFHNLTFLEVAELLTRVHYLKKKQRKRIKL